MQTYLLLAVLHTPAAWPSPAGPAGAPAVAQEALPGRAAEAPTGPGGPIPGAPAARAGGGRPTLELAGRYDTGLGAGAEIVSVQARTQRAVLVLSDAGAVDLLDLSTPERPRRLARHDLGLAPGEQLTSAAFHPRADYYVAAVQGAHAWAPGRLEMRSAVDGRLLGVAPTGCGPDAVAIDARGRHAVSANEGEPFVRDAAGHLSSPPGSVTIVALADDPGQSPSRTVVLPDATGVEGAVQRADGRALEREVDWNGDGRVEARFDFDGDGRIVDAEVEVARLDGAPVLANEAAGEVLDVPLASGAPALLEPEVPAFSPDGERVYVTLQENNAIAVIAVATGAVERVVGLGLTSHAADRTDDGRVALDEPLLALREPDGLAVTPDGRLWVTADEGDTTPKASRTPPGFPAGGGRTVSVFDAETGALLGDTGAQLDAAAHAAGVYPDDRSDSRGSEPEMVVAFELDGVPYAAVGLERAGAVALVSLADPAAPRVVHVLALPREGDRGPAPEGLAWLRDRTTGTPHVLVADEGTGRLEVLRVRVD